MRKHRIISCAFLRQLSASFSCYISAIIFGTTFVWIEPYTMWLTGENSEIPMTDTDISWLSSVIQIGVAVSCIPAGTLADRFGRKIILLSVGPICIITWLLAAFTRNLAVLYVVRFTQGAIEGIVCTVAPVYIAEISSPARRGILGGCFTSFWNLGVLIIYILGNTYSYQTFILILTIVPVVFLLTFPFMPESPYYYFMINKKDKAVESLSWFRYNEDFNEECKEIEITVEEDMKRKGNWNDLVATKSDRRALLIVQTVCIARYMTGIGTFIAFAKQTFAVGAQGPLTPDEITMLMSALFIGVSLISSYLCDIIGRRPLLLLSLIGTTISDFILAVYYYLDEKTTYSMDSYVWIMYASIAGMAISANLGFTQLMQTVKGEYFPSHTRSLGSAVTTITAAICSFIQMKLFLPITAAFGTYMNFLNFAIFALIGTILVAIFVFETAGKSLSKISKELKEIDAIV